jgi:hypothetical protein
MSSDELHCRDAETRRLILSASIPFSASDGEKVAKPDEVCLWRVGRGPT